MVIGQQLFGLMPEGRAVDIYTLGNDNGLEAQIMTYGATLVSLRAPDRSGAPADVVLGFDEFRRYLQQHPYFGCVIGRYANRISRACFNIGPRCYRLAANDGENHLHGGLVGFDKIVWNAQAQLSADGPQVALSYFSPAGEEGYPGGLQVRVTYTLTERNELRLDYNAATDQDTIVNLTNHSYFNLAGAGTIHDHLLFLSAERFLPVDKELIPIGEQRRVRGTPFDFTRPRSIGSGISCEEAQLRLAGGYDHCWVLAEESRHGALAAALYDPGSGRLMTVFTTQPGIQVYSGNFLDGSIRGKGGQPYWKNAGLCLETQHFPDAPNQPAFPATLLSPGEIYRQTAVFRFDVREPNTILNSKSFC